MNVVVIPGAEPDKTRSETAFRLLRDDIVSGSLQPGTKLKIDMLRERYDLGAGPLREALARLSGDHLVVIEGQRGFRVAPMSVDDARDIGNLRRMLEVQALRESLALGDEAWEDQLITAYHRLARVEKMDDQGIDAMDSWEKRNRAFHEALVSACTSTWLLRLRETMFHQHERYRRLSRLRTIATRDIHLEHLALFEAAMDRDVDQATALMEKHIDGTTEAVAVHLRSQSA